MTPALAHATSSFLSYLAEPAVRSLLVGGAAAVALVALRVKRAPARLQVWTAVLCAALAMPFLGIMLPRMPLAIPASAVARITERVPLLKGSGQWPFARTAQGKPAVSAQQTKKPTLVINAGTTRALHSGGSLTLDVTGKSHREILRFAGVRFAQNDRSEGVVRTARMGAADSKRDPRLPRASFAQEAGLRVTMESDGAADALEMPVMPLPMIPVITEPAGISPAQMAAVIARIALGIYAFIAVILLARLFAGMWFSGKLERAAQEIEPLYFSGADDAQNAQAREALRMLRYRANFTGLKIAPALKESAAISVPATVGVRCAAILLPLNWRAWSGEQLDAVLAHEVSHVARRDALVQTLSLVHRAIFWFSPLAWWLDRQLTELAEQASDEAALAGGADRTRYAETLLGFFAQLESAPGRIWWQGVSMAKKSHAGRAERRVDRILAWKEGMSMKKSFALAVAALAMPVIFLAASLHPVIAYGQDKTQAQSDSQNAILPGGPKAPALPKAPNGGVIAPALPAGPHGGVPAVPAMAPAPRGGVVAPAIAAGPSAGIVTPATQAVLMPVPGAPAHAPIVPGPIANGPVAPSALTRGVVAPALAPGPNPALAPTGPFTVRPSAQASAAPAAPSSVASMTAMASVASDAPMAAVAAQDEGPQPAALEKQLERARTQVTADSARVRTARQELDKANESAQGSDSTQTREAEREYRNAQAALERSQAKLARIQEQIEKIAEARTQLAQDRAALEAEHDAAEHQREAVELAQRDAQRAQVMNERNQEMAERAARKAEKAQRDAVIQSEQDARNVTINGNYYGRGPRYVIMSGADESVEMSGDDEDFHHAKELRSKLGKDLIWFERDEKSYVITDPAFIAKAKALFGPMDELSKQQDELGRQQDALGKQQDALGEQMDKVSVKPPDVTEDLQRIQARLKELQATGATQSELGEVQRELGELQRRIGEVQRDAGVGQAAIGRQQGELGRKQGELGRRQGELGRRQGEIAREANRQLRGMFDDAIAKGIAKPE